MRWECIIWLEQHFDLPGDLDVDVFASCQASTISVKVPCKGKEGTRGEISIWCVGVREPKTTIILIIWDERDSSKRPKNGSHYAPRDAFPVKQNTCPNVNHPQHHHCQSTNTRPVVIACNKVDQLKTLLGPASSSSSSFAENNPVIRRLR